MRSATLNNAAEAVRATRGSLRELTVTNNNTYAAYVKFYDAAAAGVVVGTTPIVWTYPVPAGSVLLLTKTEKRLLDFGTAISVAATKLEADADATALDVALSIQAN